MEWLTLLVEPFSFPFMVKAMLAAGVVGMVCAVLSCFMVLKGWSLMGDAVSHAVLPGVVLAWLAGIPLAIGAFASGLFCALATGYVKERCRIKEDTVMGILFSGMFAVGLVLFSRVNTEQHLSHILFGNVLGITRYELQQTLVISLLVLAVVIIKWRDLVLYCFDATQAQICGLPVKLLHYGLLTLLSLTIVAALQAVGMILVIAMLITPGITGFVLCKRFGSMMLVAVAAATFSSVFGTWLSYFLDGATGPCIVIIQSLIFLIAQCVAKIRKPQR